MDFSFQSWQHFYKFPHNSTVLHYHLKPQPLLTMNTEMLQDVYRTSETSSLLSSCPLLPSLRKNRACLKDLFSHNFRFLFLPLSSPNMLVQLLCSKFQWFFIGNAIHQCMLVNQPRQAEMHDMPYYQTHSLLLSLGLVTSQYLLVIYRII